MTRMISILNICGWMLLGMISIAVCSVPSTIICPPHCSCSGNYSHIIVNCNRTIPTWVPTNTSIVQSVFVKNWDDVTFTDLSWQQVNILKIDCNDSFAYCNIYSVPVGMFKGLHRLKELYLNLATLSQLSNNSFLYLDSLSVLSFSECKRLPSPEIVIAMSKMSILPNVRTLLLSQLDIYIASYVKIGGRFLKMIRDRFITYLDLSATTISDNTWNVTDFQNACSYLQTLNLSDATIQVEHFYAPKVCKSIQTLDISRSHFPSKAFTIPTGRDIVIPNVHLHTTDFIIFRHLKVLKLNNFIPSGKNVIILNSVFNFSSFGKLDVTEIDMSNNGIKHIDLKIVGFQAQVKKLDISNNGMEFLKPSFLDAFPFLRVLNMEHNHLDKMNFFLLGQSINRLTMLKELSMASNNLDYLSKYIFYKALHLEKLDLSNNALSVIDFNIEQLVNLKTLDISSNYIKYLDGNIIHQLDSIYNNQTKDKVTITADDYLQIDIRNHSFICLCEEYTFLAWVVSSNMFINTIDELYCEIDDKKMRVNEEAITVAKKYCDKDAKRRRLIVMATAIPICSLVFLVFIALLIKYKINKLKLEQKLEENVALLRKENDNNSYKWAVFLIFSDKDFEFVMDNIYGTLNKTLKKKTGCTRSMVCYGDNDFRPGYPIILETIRCLKASAVVVAVVSRHFCQSTFCRNEVRMAFDLEIPVIPIYKEIVSLDEMGDEVRHLINDTTRIKWLKEEGTVQPSWDNVCDSILTLVKQT